MAIYGDNIIRDRINDIYCDSTTDLSDLPTFAEEWRLKPGSSCLCVDESTVYQMKSDGTWTAL